jgi:hypothetical protein
VFSGQSLVVVLLSERQLFAFVHKPVPDHNRAGGAELNSVLDRALDDSFVHLRYLDPYQHTVFSTVQMAAVIPELERLRTAVGTEAEARTLDAVIDLARRCAAQTHGFLAFIGD